MVCAQKGYPLVVTMAESFSVERRKLMRFLGAKVVITPAAGRGIGMVIKAEELAAANGWFLTHQFENEANADMHSRTTAREIVEAFEGERLDYWVTGFGTGGTLKGVARVLDKERPETKVVVCEPRMRRCWRAASKQERKPTARRHRAIHRGNRIRCRDGVRTSFRSSPEMPWRWGSWIACLPFRVPRQCTAANELAQQEGILVGITSGAHVRRRAAALQGGGEGVNGALHAARHG